MPSSFTLICVFIAFILILGLYLMFNTEIKEPQRQNSQTSQKSKSKSKTQTKGKNPSYTTAVSILNKMLKSQKVDKINKSRLTIHVTKEYFSDQQLMKGFLQFIKQPQVSQKHKVFVIFQLTEDWSKHEQQMRNLAQMIKKFENIVKNSFQFCCITCNQHPMFCEKKQGVISIVQSLSPIFHVESCIQISQKILKFFPRCLYLVVREKEMTQENQTIQDKITKPNYYFQHIVRSFDEVYNEKFAKKKSQ